MLFFPRSSRSIRGETVTRGCTPPSAGEGLPVSRVSPSRPGKGPQGCGQSASANLAIEASKYQEICPLTSSSPLRSLDQTATAAFLTDPLPVFDLLLPFSHPQNPSVVSACEPEGIVTSCLLCLFIFYSNAFTFILNVARSYRWTNLTVQPSLPRRLLELWLGLRPAWGSSLQRSSLDWNCWRPAGSPRNGTTSDCSSSHLLPNWCR